MGNALDQSALARWRKEPTTFIEEIIRNPETGRAFTLLPAERAFMRFAFATNEAGHLLYPEQVYACPKKSGKTAFAAMHLLTTTLVFGGRFAEAYAVANDLEQAQGRVFPAVKRIVEASPYLAREANITANRIHFPQTGATIAALASDYQSAAGANPSISAFDELWAYTSERSRRLFDEMVPPPTRTVAARLIVTYAGFAGESELLEELYKRGQSQPVVGKDLHAGDGVLMFWSHEPIAPWQTPEWVEQMRRSLRPNQFARMIENRFVTSEENFVEMAWWDACTTGRQIVANSGLRVWVGVDASVKRDSTGIAVCTWDRGSKQVRLVWHRIFQPTPDSPLDFERTIEDTLLDLKQRFSVREVRYDPYQMASTAQRLSRRGLKMVEFPQSAGNLTAASQNLYELIKSGGLSVYPNAEIRLAVQRAIALETMRGWRIAKDKSAHKIDIVVALAQAALAAVQEGERPQMRMGAIDPHGFITYRQPREPLRIRWITVDENGNEVRR